MRMPKREQIKNRFAFFLLALVIVLAIASCQPHSDTGSSGRGDIVIGSKSFTEQDILAELLAQQIHNKTGLNVTTLRLGDTLVCQQALLAGQMDAYVEYLGTAFSVVLKQTAIADAQRIYQQVKQAYAERFNLTVLPSLGFEDTFAMVINGDQAKALNVQTLSQAAPYISQWRVGFGYEFTERPEFTALVNTYQLHFNHSPRLMDLGLLYRALLQGQVDLIAGNSTDAQLTRSNFVVLKDDRHAFPPYEAAPIVRAATLQKYPKVQAAIAELAGVMTADEMQRLNYLVEGELRDVSAVVREFLQSKHLS